MKKKKKEQMIHRCLFMNKGSCRWVLLVIIPNYHKI